MFLVCALLFTTVFSYSMIANASSSFTPRLDAPSYSNDYYYSNKNIYYQYGYGMPNCTAYAYGRAYEILAEIPDFVTMTLTSGMTTTTATAEVRLLKSALLLVGNITETAKQAVMLPLLKR